MKLPAMEFVRTDFKQLDSLAKKLEKPLTEANVEMELVLYLRAAEQLSKSVALLKAALKVPSKPA